MHQIPISSSFAISVVFAVAMFFGWMIWITGSVINLEMNMMTANQARYKATGVEIVQKEKNDTVCTTDVQLCPDGKTYVNRTGPRCEFTACPIQ